MGPAPATRSRAPALVFAVFLLIAAVPLLLQANLREHRRYILEVAEPARSAVTDIQLRLSLEAVAARGYLLTGDTSYTAIYEQARRERSRSSAGLRILAGRLVEPAPAQVLQLDTVFAAADRFISGFMTGALPAERYVESMPERQAAFERAAATLATLDGVIGDEIARRIERMRQIQLLEVALTSLLVVLGLSAATVANRFLADRSRQAAERAELLASERAAREEADERRRELERINESRAGLMRGFSHDVKNPLGAADGYLEMLGDGIMGPLDARQTDSVLRARRSLAHALHLIEDLIELARAETIEVQRRDLDLAELVAELVQDYRARAVAKGLDLSLAPPSSDLTLRTDSARVRQILGNLLSNAVKYTSAGSVRVAASVTHGESDRWATVSVTDTGPGISEEQQRSLFREFHRLDSAVGTEGAGIGLAISRRLARALGGDLTMRSEPGKGSAFTLSLPCG